MKVTIEIIDQSHATLAILDGHLDSIHYERVEREVVAAIESTSIVRWFLTLAMFRL